MTGNEQKIAHAAEKCLSLMDGDQAAALVIETEFLSELQADDRWSADEIREVQKWIKAARTTV